MPTTLLTLRDSLTRLTLAPELGASLVNRTRLSDGRALLRHSDEQALAAGVWLCAEDKLSSQWVELPPAWNFEEPTLLPQQLVDNAFTQWPGMARIIQADADYQLVCEAEGSDVFLLFCPQAQNFFCFEPATHPVNAHHLPTRPGLQLLAHRQSCQLHLRLHYQALAGR